MIWGAKRDVIGLDIGSSSIKMVELKEGKGGYKLQNLAIAAIPPEAIVDGALMDSVTIIDTIREMVASSKTRSRNAVTSVSGHSVIGEIHSFRHQ
jgi:type IV pilus assembly protein PilM